MPRFLHAIPFVARSRHRANFDAPDGLGAILLLAFALSGPVEAGAQQGVTVRVVRSAAVVEQPAGDAPSVGMVSPTEILEVLDEREGWYLVRPRDGRIGWRTGWITAPSVERITAAASQLGAPPLATAPATVPEDVDTAARRGFIFGLGGGAGLARTSLGFGTGSVSENSFGIGTDFRIGYAPSDQVLIYYNNKLVIPREGVYDFLGLTGVGFGYYLKRTSPSAFVSGALGFGVTGDVTAASDLGQGFSGSFGYEFSRHWSLEGEAIFIGGDFADATVFRVMFNWLFY